MGGLTKYFVFYNGERPHQLLGNQTPDVVYRTSTGGGAMILDKYPRKEVTAALETATPEAKAKSGQRRPAASEVECSA